MGAQEPQSRVGHRRHAGRAVLVALAIALAVLALSTPAHAAGSPVRPFAAERPDFLPAVDAVVFHEGAIYLGLRDDQNASGIGTWRRLDPDHSLRDIGSHDPTPGALAALVDRGNACVPGAPDRCFRPAPDAWGVEASSDGGETWALDRAFTVRQVKRLTQRGSFFDPPTTHDVAVGMWGGELVVIAANDIDGVAIQTLQRDLNEVQPAPETWERFSVTHGEGDRLYPLPVPSDSPMDLGFVIPFIVGTFLVGLSFAAIILGAVSVEPRSRGARIAGRIGGAVLIMATVLTGLLFLALSAPPPASTGAMMLWPLGLIFGGPFLIGLTVSSIAALGWHSGTTALARAGLPALISVAGGALALATVWGAELLGFPDLADVVMESWWLLALLYSVVGAVICLAVMRTRRSRDVRTPATASGSVTFMPG